MNHRTTQEQISQFLDNELHKEQLQPMFMHLAECEECRNFFVETKKIHDDTKSFEYDIVPESVDRKFSVLGMGKNINNSTPRMISFSLPSAILSGVLIFMMSLLLFLTISTKQQSFNGPLVEEQSMMFPSPHGNQFPHQ